jgi:7-carboxy-7-deazaguanine synthase
MLISEIFIGLEGETTRSGFPTLFVRTAGCNLACRWCDTKHAWEGGKELTTENILSLAREHDWIDHVTLTGGEPLLQGESIRLMEELVRCRIPVQLETNGSLDLEKVPAGVRKIVDIKLPSSGHPTGFLEENRSFLGRDDEIKMVISDREDYEAARRRIKLLPENLAAVNLSPVFGELEPGELGQWILEDLLPVRLNLQVHRYTKEPCVMLFS